MSDETFEPIGEVACSTVGCPEAGAPKAVYAPAAAAAAAGEIVCGACGQPTALVGPMAQPRRARKRARP